VFAIQVLVCERCGGARRILGAVTEPHAVRRVLTALGLADHVKAGMDVGAEDYIVKPFEPSELQERITVCLARHSNPSTT